MQPTPPRWADRLLEWFVAPHLLENVQGDLYEFFQKRIQQVGLARARREYAWAVLHYLTPFFAKRKHTAQRLSEYPHPFFLHPAMIRNYLKVAWRNVVNNKAYSAINITGLSVGMAVAMLIGLWVWDEVSFNTYHAHYGRIVQVMEQATVNGETGTSKAVSIPLRTELKTKYGSDFAHVIMASWVDPHTLTFGDKATVQSGGYIEAQAPEMLTLKMRKGTRTGLNDPASILLSESAAQALFGDADPIDKLVKLDSKLAVKVTGVYEDIPYNSSFHNMAFMAPWELLVSAEANWMIDAQNQWGNNSFQIYARLAPKADFEGVSAKIRNVVLQHMSEVPEAVAAKPQVLLHPMSRWHLYSPSMDGVSAGGRIEFVWLVSIIGAFVLLLACINFMNLSTARSEKRAKEVGIRKAVGSVRSQLIGQFFSESLLVVAIGFVVSLGLVFLSLPFFNEVADKRITMPWSEPVFWLAGLGFSLITGLIAGSYPALYLSSFQPIKVLKGVFRGGRFAAVPRKVLVVVQFTVSVTLIIGTIIVYRQIQHAQNRPVGYSRDGLVTVMLRTQDIHAHYDAVRAELFQSGTVLEMGESQSPLTEVWFRNNGFSWKGKDPNQQGEMVTVPITHEYGKAVGWQFKEGRDFSRAFTSDSTAFVVNETAVRYMGLKHPVGEIIKWGNDPHPVIGVIKDMVMESPYEPVKPTIFLIKHGGGGNYANIRLNPTVSASEALPKIEAVFKKYSPAAPFEYKFIDQEYARKFATEARIGELAGIFAGLAILISCLGLFGLASFIAEQRTKEIGVRKVLGASVFSLWGLLSKDFVVLISISLAIATPTAWYFLNDWLQNYQYRTEISWWIFAAAGAGALFITLLTVSYQAIKAALLNPIQSLRSE